MAIVSGEAAVSDGSEILDEREAAVSDSGYSACRVSGS